MLKKKEVKTRDLRAALRSQVGFTPTGEVMFIKPESKAKLFFKRFARKKDGDN